MSMMCDGILIIASHMLCVLCRDAHPTLIFARRSDMALMTIEDLERESKVSRFTWRSWIRTGRIAAVRLGRRVLVEEDEYRRFIRANVKPAHDAERR